MARGHSLGALANLTEGKLAMNTSTDPDDITPPPGYTEITSPDADPWFPDLHNRVLALISTPRPWDFTQFTDDELLEITHEASMNSKRDSSRSSTNCGPKPTRATTTRRREMTSAAAAHSPDVPLPADAIADADS